MSINFKKKHNFICIYVFYIYICRVIKHKKMGKYLIYIKPKNLEIYEQVKKELTKKLGKQMGNSATFEYLVMKEYKKRKK